MKKISLIQMHRLALAFACATMLAACGGGGGGGGGGTTTTGAAPAPVATTASTVSAVTTGPITGFGSIIINGVRYDDSAARIALDDDRTGASTDLRLGMMAQVESERDASGATARATSISTRSYVQGPVSSISVAGNLLTVLGTTVTVTSTTVFDNVTGLAALALNDRVEIHGIPNASGALVATRIEKSGSSEARLVGTVQNAATGSFTIGGITVQYQPAALVGLSTITNGTVVRIKGTLVNATTVSATAIRAITLTAPFANGQSVELEGVVVGFTDATHFSVNGVSVVVAPSAVVQGTPVNGARVEVAGTVSANVLTASKVEVRNQDQVAPEANELHGAISSLDIGTRTLTLRNGTVTVKWDGSTVFEASLPNGAASLASNLRVEIRGKVSGNVLLATRIKLDN